MKIIVGIDTVGDLDGTEEIAGDISKIVAVWKKYNDHIESYSVTIQTEEK